MPTIKVRAVDGAMVTKVDADGRLIVGRHAGRAVVTNDILADGEEIADAMHYRRAIARGELTMIAAEAAPTTKPAKGAKEPA